MESDNPNRQKFIEVPRLVLHDFLPAHEHAALLQWALDNEGRYRPARINAGTGVDPAVRRSLSLRDLGASADILRSQVASLAPQWVQALQVTAFTAGRIELELVAHNDGAFYTVHTDTYTGLEARGRRMLSGVYYFHQEPKRFTGGALRLHRFGAPRDDTGFTDIAPDQNSFVVFPSWAPHEVRPIQCDSREFAASRFAVNCWVYRDLGN